MAYLDHNATSPLRPEARKAMERAWQAQANASSVHRYGRAARALMDEAREDVARLLNARPAEVIFTSGGTEANALAIAGAVEGASCDGRPIGHLLVSSIEHDSVLKAALVAADRNRDIELCRFPVTPDGILDIDAFTHLLGRTSGRALVALMAANNETGVVQPIGHAIELAHKNNNLVLVDAVQSCGKAALDFASLGADYLTVSGHKLGGPQGAGALLLKESAPLSPQVRGGGQERYRRAGTENVAAIAGFAAAARASQHDDSPAIARLRDKLESGLCCRYTDVVIFGAHATRLANTSNFAVPGISAETALIALDLDGVMVSSGSACSSGRVNASRVLKAMGVPQILADSALRVSFGWDSTEADVEAALESLEKHVARTRARKAA